MRYIEKDLPIESLNEVALKEGNSKRPIYQIHKWWARRLGSIFRMLTLAAFADETDESDDLWRRFYQGADFGGPVVLDPFMGGGTGVVEALRLGCKVIGVDVNPVAWFITRKEIEPVDLGELDAAFGQLERDVGNQIRGFYRTRCPDGHAAEGLYYFWVKTLSCPGCSETVRLFPSHELLRKGADTTLLCPGCNAVFTVARDSEAARCPDCRVRFSPSRGNAGRGKYRCTACGSEGTVLEAVQAKGGRLDLQLVALEYHCKACGRGFKTADEADLGRFEDAKAEFEKRKESLLFPKQAIPSEGRSDPRPINHGYTHFWMMFNERQLLCLAMLLEGISRIQDQNLKEFLLLAFSDSLDANNMFCKYEVEWQKISLLFGLHAYHPIERPAENNVWGSDFGRGTFVKCYEKLRRAKVYAATPFERVFRGGNGRRVLTGDRIEGRLADSASDLLSDGDKNALVLAHDSRDLSMLPEACVDVVITDPPYFDNVAYSELSDFFYVWLRLALSETYHWFQPDVPRRDVEIVQNPKLSGTIAGFAAGLTAVFKECHRVVKDDGILLFTFHHRQPWAWQELAQILLNSGFYVSGTPIVRSEGKSGFHSSEGNIKYDACLACRKRADEAELGEWGKLKEAIIQDTESWVLRLLHSGMAVNPVDVLTITMAKALERYTTHWPNVVCMGQEVDIRQAVSEAYEIHDDIARRLLPGARYTLRTRQRALFEPKAKWRSGHPRSP